MTHDALPPEVKHAHRLERYSLAISLVEEGKASAAVAETVKLLREGFNGIEIAEILDIARSTVYQHLSDPLNTKANTRRAKNNGVCLDCGGPTRNGGAIEAPIRCITCARTRNVERNERILELWEQGWKGPQIGEELGMTAEAVQSFVHDKRRNGGWPITMHRLQNRAAWPEIARRWNAGENAREIAAAVGSTRESVWNMLRVMRKHGAEVERRQP